MFKIISKKRYRELLSAELNGGLTEILVDISKVIIERKTAKVQKLQKELEEVTAKLKGYEQMKDAEVRKSE